MESRKAVSFFCIGGAKDIDNTFSFRATKNTLMTVGTATKAEKLNENTVLRNLHVEDIVAFDIQSSKAARDWTQEPAIETRCKLLATFARSETGVPDLDNHESVWQMNWVQVIEPPQEQSIKTNDGSRLWFLVTVRDDSGTLSLYITEQAALTLANVIDAAGRKKCLIT